MTALDDEVVDRFRDVVTSRLGLAFDDAKRPALAEVLARRAAAVRAPVASYVERLAAVSAPDELGELARDLTVSETYFFRNPDQFRAFAGAVVPAIVATAGPRRRLRALSAGCASGEEPYSIAIALRDALREPGWEASIVGVDVNPAALERAAQGRYSPWALRETGPEMQHRWFSITGRDVLLDERIRRDVVFEARNLAAEEPDLWRPESFDVVFCRNVMMYFTRPQATALVARISRALAPGGFLFLGHAETLRGLSEDFDLCHTHGTFYYRKKDSDGRARPVVDAGEAAIPGVPISPAG